MNEVEYILRIILRARNEMRQTFANAAKQIEEFAKSSRKLDKDLGNLNTRMTSLNTRVGNATDKIKAWRAEMEGFGRTGDKTGKSIQSVYKEVDNLTVKSQRAIKTQKDLRDEFDRLAEANHKLNDDFRSGKRDRDDVVFGLNNIGQALDRLAKKATIGSDISYELRRAAAATKDQAKGIVDAEKKAADDRIKIAESVKARRIATEKEAAAELKKIQDDLAKEEAKKQTEQQRAVTARLKANEQELQRSLAAQRKAREEATKLVEDQKRLEASIADTTARWRDYERELSRGSISHRNASGELRRFAQDFEKLRREFPRGSAEEQRFARSADNVRDRLAGLAASARTSTKEIDRHTESTRRAGTSARSMGSELRGLAIALIGVFSQQLITAVAGLGGELVALASSAAMAGGAIGGILAAGIAQAIPVAGLLVGALSRVKAVINAVQEAQKVQQAQSQARYQAGRKEADGNDAIASALESLANAQRQVGLAQDALTKTRAEARRQLVDMTLAERDAELAAKGATLSQAEAQEALRRAIATGQGVERAQLGVAEANAARRRASIESGRQTADVGRARAGGVEGMPDVQAGVRAVQDAQRAVTSAQRGLEAARRNANEAVSGTQTAAANLNWLLSQLSPAERKLYEAIRRVQHTWKTAWTGADGIIEPIIESFTHGVNRINTIMQMPSVLNTARNLSKEIGNQLSKFTDSFTSDKAVAQFKRISDDARKNLAPVEGIAQKVGHAFLNIAEAAGPSFQKFLGYVGRVADKFLKLTEDQPKVTKFFNTAEDHLESWLNLAGAVGDLFLAISGAGGAAEGKKSIDDLTKSIQGMADWVRTNSGRVHKFFEDSRKVTDDVISVIKTLAGEIVKTFSPGHLKRFADFLNQTVIPALGIMIRATSGLSDVILKFLDLPVVGDLAKWGIALGGLSYIGGSTITTFGKLGGRIADFGKTLGGLRSTVLDAGPKLAAMGERLTLGAKFGEAAGQGGKLTSMFAKIGPIATRAGAMMGAASEVALGPWGIAIGAVILAIILLDKKFHFLEPTFRWLKHAFGDVIDWLKTHWPLVLTILTGPFGLAVTLVVKHWKAISHAVTNAVNAIKGVVGDVADWVVNKLRGLGRRVLDILPNPFKKAGKGAADGLVDGIKSIVHFFSHIGEWLFDHVIKPIYDFFEIKSPSGLFKRLGKQVVEGYIEGFKLLPNLLIDAVKAMGQALQDVGGAIGDWIRKGLEKVPGGKLIIGAAQKVHSLLHLAEGGPVPGSGSGDTVSALLTPGEHVLTKSEVQAAGGHAAIFALRAMLGGGGQGTGGRFQRGGAAAGAGSLTIAFAGGGLDDFVSQWRDFWRSLISAANNGTDAIQREFRQMRVATTASADRMYRDVRGSLADIEHSFDVRGGRMSDSWVKLWQGMATIAYKTLNYVGHEANLSLDAFGSDKLDFHLRAPDVSKAATGGIIGNLGERGRDLVPALVGRGEAVLNWAHQPYVNQALYEKFGFGLRGLFDRVRGYHAGGPEQPGFAKGGLTGPFGSGAAFTAIANFAKQKFGLTMTAGRTNHGYNTSTGNVSDHSWGGAGDFSDGYNTPHEDAFNSFIKSKIPQTVKQLIWQGKDQLRGFPISDHWDHVHYAVQRALAFDLPRMAKILSRAGRGLSISDLLANVSDSEGAPTVDHIDKLTVTGARPIARLINKMIAKVIAAGNAFIDDKAGDYTTTGGAVDYAEHGKDSLSQSTVESTIRKALSILKYTKNVPMIIKAFTRQAYNESTWNPSAQNKTPAGVAAGGPKGILQVVDGTFAAYKYPGHNSVFSALDNILASMRYVAAQYGGGDLGRGADVLWGRGGGAYAKGGIVGGGDGTPVSIVAHAGEWILNKVQQARLAGLTGLHPSALKSMLGFSGGRGSYAQGGDPGDAATDPDVYQALTTASVKKIVSQPLRRLVVFIRQLGRDLDEASTSFGEPASWTKKIDDSLKKINGIGTYLDDHIKKLKPDDRARGVRAVVDATDKLLGDQGLFSKIRASVERFTGLRTQRALRQQFVPQSIGGTRVVVQRGTEVDRAQQAVKDQNTLHDELLAEQARIARAMKAAKDNLARTKDPKTREKILGQINEIQQDRDAARERIGQSLQDLWEAQQAVLQAQLDAQQTAVDTITKEAERGTAANELKRRIATLFGQDGVLSEVSKTQQNILQTEHDKLQAQLAAIQGIDSPEARDFANQIADQIKDLEVQIQETIAQNLQDQADKITQDAQRSQGRLDLVSRMLAATGTVGRGIARTVGGDTFSAAGIAQQQQLNTQSSIEKTTALITKVEAEQPQNMKLLQQLHDSLDDLTVTLQEQRRAAFQARVEDVNTQHDYTQTINDLDAQILTLTGALSGNTDNVKLLQLATDKHADLLDKGTEIQKLLNEAIANQDEQATHDLEIAMRQNTVATLQAKQAMDDLAGVTKEPQTFTSSAWTLFRQAIFTGMGQVLPQYDTSLIPSAQGGGIAMRAGVYNLHPGELIKPAGSWHKEGDVNLTINESGRPIDTTEISGAIAFARKVHQ